MEADLSSLSLLSSHIDVPRLLRRDLSAFHFISVLRDPIEREISTYRYILSHRNHPHHDLYKDCSFDEYFERIVDRWNLQCRLLCGEPSADKAIKVIRERLDLVGTAENMHIFQRALCERFGFVAPPDGVPRTHVAKGHKVDLTSQRRDELRSQLSEDYKLYDFVGPMWLST